MMRRGSGASGRLARLQPSPAAAARLTAIGRHLRDAGAAAFFFAICHPSIFSEPF